MFFYYRLINVNVRAGKFGQELAGVERCRFSARGQMEMLKSNAAYAGRAL
jgi:hypothetical protein